MQTRLLAFLSDVELYLKVFAGGPGQDMEWDCSRTVNYPLGLARLSLAGRRKDGTTQPVGSVLLQSFTLADGAFCLKATLTWQNADAVAAHALYAKPGLNWKIEAEKVAETWTNGPVESPAFSTVSGETSLAATG